MKCTFCNLDISQRKACPILYNKNSKCLMYQLKNKTVPEKVTDLKFGNVIEHKIDNYQLIINPTFVQRILNKFKRKK